MNNKYFSDSIAIGFITIIGYLMSYSYEKGYSGYFGIPPDMIVINITKIMISISSLLSFIIFMYMTTSVIYMLIPKFDDETLKRKTNITLTMIVIVLASAYANKFEWVEYRFIFFFCSLMLIIEYGLPLITHKDTVGYINKLKGQENIDKNSSSINSVIVNKYGSLSLLIFSATVLLIIFAGDLGKSEAKHRKEHYFIKDTDLVMLRSYESKIYCSRYNQKDNSLDSGLVIIETNDRQSIELVPRNTGTLIKNTVR